MRTLYDKLEDQSLHMASQLARHQADLRGFYDRICQQTEGLKQMLQSLDVSMLAKATENAAKMKAESGGVQVEGELKLFCSRHSNVSIYPFNLLRVVAVRIG